MVLRLGLTIFFFRFFLLLRLCMSVFVSVFLSGTKVSDTGLQALVTVLPESKVTSVDLWSEWG